LLARKRNSLPAFLPAGFSQSLDPATEYVRNWPKNACVSFYPDIPLRLTNNIFSSIHDSNTMKLSIASSLLIACIVALSWAGCSKDSQNPDYIADANCSAVVANTNTYTLAIKDIMDNSCALGGCHDSATKSEGVDLSTYAGTKTAFESQNLLCAVNHGSGCEPMPKGSSKLPQATLDQLACWAKNGYVQ